MVGFNSFQRAMILVRAVSKAYDNEWNVHSNVLLLKKILYLIHPFTSCIVREVYTLENNRTPSCIFSVSMYSDEFVTIFPKDLGGKFSISFDVQFVDDFNNSFQIVSYSRYRKAQRSKSSARLHDQHKLTSTFTFSFHCEDFDFPYGRNRCTRLL